MTDLNHQRFIDDMAEHINRIRGGYNILVASPIIAQAIVESGWGTSNLSKHFNYFGLTCGSSWKGQRVSGTKQDFRAYGTMTAGIRGYFEFLDTQRYANLKGVQDPETYIDNLIADGYCDDKGYKEQLMAVIEKYNLRQYDVEVSAADVTYLDNRLLSADVNMEPVSYDIEDIVDIVVLAEDIMDGRYGNGEERVKSLKALGLSNKAIELLQLVVNKYYERYEGR